MATPSPSPPLCPSPCPSSTHPAAVLGLCPGQPWAGCVVPGGQAVTPEGPWFCGADGDTGRCPGTPPAVTGQQVSPARGVAPRGQGPSHRAAGMRPAPGDGCSAVTPCPTAASTPQPRDPRWHHLPHSGHADPEVPSPAAASGGYPSEEHTCCPAGDRDPRDPLSPAPMALGTLETPRTPLPIFPCLASDKELGHCCPFPPHHAGDKVSRLPCDLLTQGCQ